MIFAIVAVDAPSGTLGVAWARDAVGRATAEVQPLPGTGLAVVLGSRRVARGALDLDVEPQAHPREIIRAVGDRLPGGPRQVFAVDLRGRTGALSTTGPAAAYGHTEGTDHVAGGNGLRSPNVVGAMSLSFERSAGDPLWQRLLFALESGERAGDAASSLRRAALEVYTGDLHLALRCEAQHRRNPMHQLRRIVEARVATSVVPLEG